VDNIPAQVKQLLKCQVSEMSMLLKDYFSLFLWFDIFQVIIQKPVKQRKA
jgi:hypothetical protein